jgi:hypothetical protein
LAPGAAVDLSTFVTSSLPDYLLEDSMLKPAAVEQEDEEG